MKNAFNFAWPKTVYVTAEQLPFGDGSKDKPLVAPDGCLDVFQHQLIDLIPELEIILKDGEYTIEKGLRVGSKFRMRSESGKRESVVIHAGSELRNNFAWPGIRLISDGPNWCHLFILEDLTLDMGWGLLSEDIRTTERFKTDVVAVRCTRGLANNIVVRNFGSNGKGGGIDGWECFPLNLQTFSSGPPWTYFIRYAGKIGDERDWSYVEIRDCLVEGGNFLNGGYCSAIGIATCLGADLGDRMKLGDRSTPAGLITGCDVRNVYGGIAYSVGRSENVTIRNCKADGCQKGLNFDTDWLRGFVIENCTFTKANMGMEFVTWNGCQDVRIEGNVIELSKPWLNPASRQYGDFFGFKVVGPHIINLKAVNNLIVAPSGQNKFKPFIKFPSTSARVILGRPM